MTELIPTIGKHVVMPKTGLQDIFEALLEASYTVVGPTIDQEAIVYEPINDIGELPIGWTDDQGPGEYRIRRRDDGKYFGYVVGPTTWKKYLYPPETKLFSCQRKNGSFNIRRSDGQHKYAFIGVRGCELAAIAIQDHILLEGQFHDPHYKDRREHTFVLAVNCTEPGETCFCSSMNSGPQCRSGFDLALTELAESFLVEVGSEVGAEMLSECSWRPAGAFEMNQAGKLMDKAALEMGRSLETDDLPDLLYTNLDSPRWDDVAQRCLSCTNCTMVCPTCFCVDVQDVSDLSGENTERIRVWDSCFNSDYSYVHGGNTRPNIRSRYRQWLTHKMASWIDQFGEIGCTGCGRCITWCPVGIDLTEEIAAIREGGQS
jgi:sulfhydrogenase subunit beta (sulfur reductase)